MVLPRDPFIKRQHHRSAKEIIRYDMGTQPTEWTAAAGLRKLDKGLGPDKGYKGYLHTHTHNLFAMGV